MDTENTPDSMPTFADAVEILLVDDDDAWSAGTARLLEHSVEAFRVTTAASLAAAERRYRPGTFDCVVCDYHLGDGTGLGLLETVRKTEPERPFILVTGRGDEQVASKAIRRGVTNYVTKDSHDSTTLLATCIARAVDSYRTEQALTRERRSKNALLELLTATSDETELCREFCSILVKHHGYSCAWIGTKTDSGLIARAAVGDDSFLEKAVYDLPETAGDRDPTLEALATNGPVVRQLPPAPAPDTETAWQTLAREYGFERAAGIPLAHEGIQFGVLGVYATGRPTLDADRLESLSAFADTLGYALHTADFKRSLGPESVTVEIEISDRSVPLVAFESGLPEGSRLGIPSVVFGETDRTVAHVRIEGATGRELAAALDETASVSLANGSNVPDAEGPIQCAIAIEGRTPEAMLADHGARLTHTVVEAGTATMTVRLPGHRTVSTAADTLRATFEPVVVSSICQDHHATSLDTVESLLEPLTEKQATAIRHAYYEGFFEHPRETTATELAGQFAVTRQTLTHHLRAAERKLLAQLFER